jgi:hypothetical protein
MNAGRVFLDLFLGPGHHFWGGYENKWFLQFPVWRQVEFTSSSRVAAAPVHAHVHVIAASMRIARVGTLRR